MSPHTDFLCVKRRIPQRVRRRMYRDKVPAKVEILLQRVFAALVQHYNIVLIK